MHDADSIGKGDEFLHLARGKEYRTAVSDAAIHQSVDLLLRPDVDASRGLIEKKDCGLEGQPTPQHHLLLVASGQATDEACPVRRLDVEVPG